MRRLKEIVLGAPSIYAAAAPMCSWRICRDRYIADLTNRARLKRKLKVVAACGNGTAGAFAPRVLEAVGCQVFPLDCELDHTFPRYNPNYRRHEDAARHA